MRQKAPSLPPKRPPEDVLAVARALAILHARRDHDAELARLASPPARVPDRKRQ